MGRFVLDGVPVSFSDGDSVAVAIARAGEHPLHGGTLCLAGDCGNCVAVVDGTAWVRTCQVEARPGMVVQRHPAVGAPSAFPTALALTGDTSGEVEIVVRHSHIDLVVVGAGDSGTAAASASREVGRDVTVLDARDGNEVVGIYAGPTVIVRTRTGMLHVHAHEVVIATGAAELQPVCPGNDLRGIVTVRAAEALWAAGVDLGRCTSVGDVRPVVPSGVWCQHADGDLLRIVGSGGRVTGVVTSESEIPISCDTVVVGLGFSSRDVLLRMAPSGNVSAVGPAAAAHPLPPSPTEGIACPCSKVLVEDWHGVWDRGFRELELMKRASLTGTGTCQGSVCVPHLRAFISAQTGDIPQPFTARPAARQITLGEAAADVNVAVFRRTALHEEHLKLGALMDRFAGWWRPWHYGDVISEYWAVREGVSLGDVGTLGKMIVSGPDVVEFLERLYPNHVADIKPGRSRYVLVLNERGHLMDDGMIVRESDTRFVLTFTSGGASNAEMWVRDWLETWKYDVHVMDRTASLGAINVTGPYARTLLQRVGLEDPPKFLQHIHASVASVPCHVMRLSFTGEASFELHHPVDRSVELWQALMEAGRSLGVRPHGLQALQALRLEKGHVIIGMDSEMDSTPRRLGMEWAVKMDKPDFLGRDALVRTLALPDNRVLRGFTMASSDPDGSPLPAPIDGTPIWYDGSVIGNVTSSFTSPGLGKSVMLGWLKQRPFPDVVTIDGRPATVAPTPFYDPEGRRARA